jgi:hypothetical protein
LLKKHTCSNLTLIVLERHTFNSFLVLCIFLCFQCHPKLLSVSLFCFNFCQHLLTWFSIQLVQMILNWNVWPVVFPQLNNFARIHTGPENFSHAGSSLLTHLNEITSKTSKNYYTTAAIAPHRRSISPYSKHHNGS